MNMLELGRNGQYIYHFQELVHQLEGDKTRQKLTANLTALASTSPLHVGEELCVDPYQSAVALAEVLFIAYARFPHRRSQKSDPLSHVAQLHFLDLRKNEFQSPCTSDS